MALHYNVLLINNNHSLYWNSIAVMTIKPIRESQEVKEIKRVYAGLHTLYHTYFPKSDPSLVHDLLRRSQKDPDIIPIYMVEVFTKPGVSPEAAKKYIFEKTGMVPAIFENGTLFVTNQKLTLEMLKEISDSDDVLEVAGDYTGSITGRGSSHVHSDACPIRNPDYTYYYTKGF